MVFSVLNVVMMMKSLNVTDMIIFFSNHLMIINRLIWGSLHFQLQSTELNTDSRSAVLCSVDAARKAALRWIYSPALWWQCRPGSLSQGASPSSGTERSDEGTEWPPSPLPPPDSLPEIQTHSQL